MTARVAVLVLWLCWLLLAGPAGAAIDLTHSTIVARPAPGPEQAAVTLLTEEVERRTGVTWTTDSGVPGLGPLIVVGRREQVGALLPPGLHWSIGGKPQAEAYAIRSFIQAGRPVIAIAGDDARGVLYGIGDLLRSLSMQKGRAWLSAPLDRRAAPAYPLRSHQIGYRFKNNSYDAWSLPQFEQEIRDLAVFGTNAIQLIAPVSDDERASPLFPAPATETILGIAGLLVKYGLDCDLYYPVIRADYADPGTVAAELADFEGLVRRFPAIHALYVPGGDPGHTPPDILFGLLEKMAAILRRHHPAAALYVSGQGFDQAAYAQFYAQLDRQPDWLTGVFFGPQSRDPLARQRARIPARYPILFYPDIGHTLHAQYPVPDWDPAFALLQGREPINPRPSDQTRIFQHFAPLTAGFVTYSEGVNDDVNKMLWSRLGWSPATRPEETLADYARYFLGPTLGQDQAGRAAALILDLERNWRGPVAANSGINATLQGFLALADGAPRGNWRLESLLYRAYYDAYARRRALAESARQARALEALEAAPRTSSLAAMDRAEAALTAPDDAWTRGWRLRLFDLAQDLFDHAGLQLSVTRFGASGVERGANLDRIDMSLNDRVWLTDQFARIRAETEEATRLCRLRQIVQWEQPVPGTLYDDLGDPARSPHLDRGPGFDRDPQLLSSAIHSVADTMPDAGWRLSWVTYAESLYETPLTLRYHGLDSSRRYRLRVTYGGEDYHLPIRLIANGDTEIHAPLTRPANPSTLEFDIPAQTTRNGRLTLRWTRPPGMGGSGRGKQVAEVWLMPVNPTGGTGCP